MNVEPEKKSAPSEKGVLLESSSFNRLEPSNPGVTVRFFQEVTDGHDDNGTRLTRLEEHAGKPSYHYTIVSEACKIVKSTLITGNRYLRCYLYWLPIEVRFQIYEVLFVHDGSALEIGRLKRTGIANLAILRTCHAIYHETSIALYHSLSYRKLFLRTSFESVVFLLGASDFRVAVQRRWAFSEFITTLRMGEPLKIYSLTIVVTENWKMPGFNETDLVKALLSGAIDFLGKLRFRGFTEEERKCLCQLVHSLKIQTLRIERQKKKIQGPGFSIWVFDQLFHVQEFDPRAVRWQ
ncbi:hypothetical protein EYZ11_008533 [Aspergillus tanneri]|uniref:Uncharacterized protein n=1 Tax=Aspergillus tanneri TaxID=1220188 RepID=A0A4S3JA82_9EURO|nr:hypothetical protein EYZ11_008533 [Aspergillus tanneri]